MLVWLVVCIGWKSIIWLGERAQIVNVIIIARLRLALKVEYWFGE